MAAVTSQVTVLHGGEKEQRVPGQHQEAERARTRSWITLIFICLLCRIAREQDPIKELLFA